MFTKNLLKETEKDILDSGHTIEDIIFIGSEKSGHQCTWDEFKVLADFDYDAGYGSASVATDLIIVFRDGHKMWRGEYDGSEWWDYSAPFVAPTVSHRITCLVDEEAYSNTLKEMN